MSSCATELFKKNDLGSPHTKVTGLGMSIGVRLKMNMMGTIASSWACSWYVSKGLSWTLACKWGEARNGHADGDEAGDGQVAGACIEQRLGMNIEMDWRVKLGMQHVDGHFYESW